MYRRARKEGLGLTVHAGEDEGHNSVREVLEHLEPERIGHGVRATEDAQTLEMLRERGVTLELCPSSNLNTRVLKGVGDMKRVFRQLNKSGVKYTINTDGPEMLLTNLRNEIDFLLRNDILKKEDVLRANRNAFAASFIHPNA
jgi:adenosine deaminase